MSSFLFVFILSSLVVAHATVGYRYVYKYQHGSYYRVHYGIRCSWLGCYRYVISAGKATPAPPRNPVCASDSDCVSSKFCDRYLHHCRACKPLNGLCRRDENCCNGRVCKWGCCNEPKKPICANDSDCGSSKFCDRYLYHCRDCKPLNSLCRRDENCCNGKVCERGFCKEPKKPICASDSDCGPSKFCDRYLHHCRDCKPLNGLCRRNKNCCDGRVCERGCCQEPKKPGSEGSACKYDVDCNTGMCCAKEQSKFICKKLGKLNEDCYEPEGGLGYSLHHKCPCGQGLRCQEFLYRWSRHTYMYYTRHHQCVRKLTPVTKTPSTEAPSTETPSTVTPTTEIPSTEIPSTTTPSKQTPSTETPSTETPSTEIPSTENPSTATPSTESPSTQAPSTEAPSTETPSTETPSTEVPVSSVTTDPFTVFILNTEEPTTREPIEVPEDEGSVENVKEGKGKNNTKKGSKSKAKQSKKKERGSRVK